VNILRVLALFLAAAAACPARAASPVAEGRVAAVIDGDTLTLSDGAEVRLVGIQAPKLPLGRSGFRPWPLGAEAKAALESLSLGREVALAYGGAPIDRHGRLLAHVTVRGGAWVQGEMLERGLARVYTFADNRARAAEMLARESRARAARRGIWTHPFYAVRGAADPDRIPVGGFELVEGTVLAAAVVRGRGYLNFGPDLKTDFTVSIAPRSLRDFGGTAAVAAYRGAALRVRGWVDKRNGPMIDATHPEQIERLK
jgi:endonuclease YncB( thermonuclease family)